jgi:carbonic anhydrase
MKSIVSFTLTTLSLSFALHAFASEAPHWSYEGQEGPAHWGDISQEYSECKLGRNQSPINITHAIKGDLSKLDIQYQAGGDRIINNGHTVQVNYAPGSTLSLDGHTYELKQFHFHTPSENQIEGKNYPMEGHFVHADTEGNLAVLAVMFDGKDSNSELAKAWSQMPKANDGEHAPYPLRCGFW